MGTSYNKLGEPTSLLLIYSNCYLPFSFSFTSSPTRHVNTAGHVISTLFSPSFLPATSTHLSTFIRFSSVRPSSAWIALFLAPLRKSCLHFSNMFTWTGCCCCFSHHPLSFTLTRCKKRAPDVWGTDEQRFHHWVTHHSPQSNSTQTSVSGTFQRNIPCWAGQEQNQHYCCSSFLEIAILVHSILLASAHQPFLPPAPVISNVVAGIWGLLQNWSL